MDNKHQAGLTDERIREIHRSVPNHHIDFARAIEREVLAAHSTDARNGEGVKLVASNELLKTIKPRPLDGPLDDYWFAPCDEGPRAYDWKDKPHRLVYDLIAHVLYYATPADAASEAGEINPAAIQREQQ